MSEIVIEKMSERHIADIALIEKASFSVPWSENALRDELLNPNACFFAAVCCGKTIGYVGSYSVCGECYITNIAVLPEYRKRGIGEKLLSALIENCRKENCTFLTLEVRKSNMPAISLYEKLGFERAGERKDFYEMPTENALLYTKFFR